MLPILVVPGETTRNILTEKVRMPEWWAPAHSASVPRTKTQIDSEVNKRNIADPSYDLDGDGVVCAKDYFLAKRFDLDRDGKLNPLERKKAIAALQNGYEDNFRWNIEAAGSTMGSRIIQLRGKIIEGENFCPIGETYPTHPLTKHTPTVESVPELKAKRKDELMYLFEYIVNTLILGKV